MRDLDLTSTTLGPPPAVEASGGNLIEVLWRGRWFIAASMLACLGLAGVYLFLADRAFEASARLLILRQGNRPLTVGDGVAGRLVEDGDDTIPTQAIVLRSPVVVERAIRAIGPENLPSLGGPEASDLGRLRRAIECLKVTRPDRAAQVLQVDYRAGSAAEAVRMERAIINSYQEVLEEVYQEDNGVVVRLITNARDDLDAELKALEGQYLEFRRLHPLLTGEDSGRPFISRRVDEWDRAANEAMVKAVRLKAQLELGRRLESEGVGLRAMAGAMEQLGSPGTGGLGARAESAAPSISSDYLRQLAQEQQRLADRLGPQSTRVREIQDQFEQARDRSRDVRRQFEGSEIRDLLGSVEASLQSIEAMQGEIARRFEDDMEGAKEAEIDRLTESNLRGNLDRQRSLFNTVVDQLKQARLAGDFLAIQSHVVAPASASPSPVRPQVPLVLAISLVVGGLVGVGAAVASDLFDPRLRTTDEVRRVLRLPLLAQVPYQSGIEFPRTGLICQAMPRSHAAEAFRVARTNLDLARRHRQVSVILVAGPRGGEGKSTVASNLAISLAQAGRKVLLVDADLRHPRQHAIHGLGVETGLVQVLRDGLPLGRAAQATAVPGLQAIASGVEDANPAELLSASRLEQFLDEARDAYDAVVLDSPALLSVADASILGAAADGVVLVVRAASTRRDDAARALEALDGLGTPVFGVLVNGIAPVHHLGAWAEARPVRMDCQVAELRSDPQLTFNPGPARVGTWIVPRQVTGREADTDV